MNALTSLLRTESNQAIGIAVFPMPAKSSPAMSSLPLAVERLDPVCNAHTDDYLLCNLTVQQLQYIQSASHPPCRFPILDSPQSAHTDNKIQPQTQPNTQPRQAFYNRMYNTSEALPGSLLGASRNHFFTPPSSGHFDLSRILLPSVEHVSSASSSCGYLRACSIYLRHS